MRSSVQETFLQALWTLIKKPMIFIQSRPALYQKIKTMTLRFPGVHNRLRRLAMRLHSSGPNAYGRLPAHAKAAAKLPKPAREVFAELSRALGRQ
jgi:hypothetical protein